MPIDPVTAGISAVDNLGSGLIALFREKIKDPDLAATLSLEALKLQAQTQMAILQTATVPWVDATVKLVYALQQAVVAMFRPVGSALMNAFGMWMLYEGVITAEEASTTAGVIGGLMQFALPAWGGSRHMEKARQQKEETKRQQYRAIAQAGQSIPPRPPDPGFFEH